MLEKKGKEVSLILHNIRSVHNTGAIFRTAECAGVSRVYLTGYTPSPFDRFGRPRNDFHKAALGAEKLVPWEERKNVASLIEELKKCGFFIVALEQEKNSVDYKKIKARGLTAIIVGNEVKGLRKEILKSADAIAEIPLQGKKESLNVSVATGIFLFRLLNI